MSNREAWYIVKLETGQCSVVSVEQLDEVEQAAQGEKGTEKWGPFDSQADAIARRVGLIRAGKCQPV